MRKRWADMVHYNISPKEAAEIMNCHLSTAIKQMHNEVRALACRTAAIEADLQETRERRTAVENTAYVGCLEWANKGQHSISDRCPDLVGINDRVTSREKPTECFIPLAAVAL